MHIYSSRQDFITWRITIITAINITKSQETLENFETKCNICNYTIFAAKAYVEKTIFERKCEKKTLANH